MNKINVDLSITISVIIALAAIISPILTALINNSHQKKMKELELKQNHYEKTISYQRNVFENYLGKTGIYIGAKCNDLATRKAYDEAYLEALLFAPKDLQELMKEANNSLSYNNYDKAIQTFENLIPSIQEYLKTL